jgi:phage tail sheath protein FI
MAEVIISPGVFQQETDQSFYNATPQVVGAALVGPTVLGVPFVPTYVTNYNQFRTLYGETFKSGSYYYEYWTSLAAKEYFANGGQTMLITRVISGSANATTYAQSTVNNAGNVASASVTFGFSDGASFIVTGSSDGVTTSSFATFFITSSTTQTETSAIKYIVTGSTTGSTVNNIISKFGSLSSTFGIIGTRGSGNAIDFTSVYGGTIGNGFKVSGNSFTGGAANGATIITFETLAWGNVMNNTSTEVNGALPSGSAQNVRLEVAYSDPTSGLFTLLVRRGDDTTAQKNVLETWSNMSLDPQLPNYVGRVIGDLKPTPDVATGVVSYSGSFANKSAFIRVKSVLPMPDSLDNNGNFKTATFGAFMPAVGSGSFDSGVADTSQTKNMYEAATTANLQGFAPADYVNAFRFLTDKDNYQFNVLLAPGIGLDATTAANAAITTVENRGDSVFIADAGIYSADIATAVSNAGNYLSNYAAAYYPWVSLFSAGLGKAVWCPPSTVLGGVLAYNDSTTAEWFAPAGLNRGGIPSVIAPSRRVQQTDRDVLYNGRVNPLATFPNVGVCVWGQKTLQKKPSALDRLNVRRLLIALKGFIGGIARTLVFEQNTTTTRNRFLAQVNPYLSSVVQRQGLYAYKVIMDATNNTPDVIDRNQLVGQIYIQPTKTAEFVILNFNILPTGATFPA